MKTVFQFVVLLFFSIGFTACVEDECTSEQEYIIYEPIYLEEDEFRVEITATESRELCEPGGFYVYGDYLLIVEQNEGLHIMDNSDETNPQPISYLPVGGAVGLSVRNNILYINNYVDLVTFSLENPAEPRMLNRSENVFDTYGIFNPELGYNQVVTGYRETEATYTVACGDLYYTWGCFMTGSGELAARRGIFASNEVRADVAAFTVADFAGNRATGPQPETVGVGGSLARFTITNQTLYIVNESSLKAFDLSDPARPEAAGTVSLNWGVETIFPAGDELYIGTQSGMHIMDASNPLNPQLLSTLEHVRACDPVVVKGNRAYVTLKGRGICGGFSNQLDVVDITDKRNPQLIRSYEMNGPVGLTVGENQLFICEPNSGMRIMSLDEEGMPIETTSIIDELRFARDVIGLHYKNHLITIGTDGVRQLRYGDLTGVTELSVLNICPNL